LLWPSRYRLCRKPKSPNPIALGLLGALCGTGLVLTLIVRRAWREQARR
jgi:hypothetical protein